MSFANPAALLWTGLAIPIILFYIMKVRLRRVPVSTNLFWREIFQEKRPRSLWHYFRHLLSLFLQILFLGLLVVALAGPFFASEVQDARRLALVMDNSASMNATDVSPTRLAQALALGQRLVGSLRWRDEMAVIVAGSQPEVVCGLTGHQRTLREALARIAPTDGPTRAAEAVTLARRLLADHGNRKVILLTDGCFAGADALATAADVQMIRVGQRSGNVGITRFQVRRSLQDPLGYSILAEMVNASDEPVECRLELELDGEPVDVVPLTLPANGQWNHVFEATSTKGGRLVARIDRPDALLTDNQAVALLPRRQVRPVLLVSKGRNVFLEKVFDACPLVDLTVTDEPPRSVLPGTILVFHRTVPASLPPGPVLIIDPAGPSDLWKLGEKRPASAVTKQDKESRLMAYLSLDKMTVPAAWRLEMAERFPVRVLASTLADDPVFCAIERPEGKVLVLNVNLERCELPLRTAFPILASNALSWLVDLRDELHESVAAGERIEVDLPGRTPGPSELHLWAPDGSHRTIRPQRNEGLKAAIGPLDQCGVWSLAAPRADNPDQPESPPVREIACNLVNRRKSDLRPPEGLAAETDLATSGFAGKPLWCYLLAGAWLLSALEWYLYQRRWIS
jgi:hypothetical protein